MDLFRSLSDKLGIQWAPLDIPLERRLQTLAVFCWFHFMTSCGVIFSIYFFIKLVYSDFWYLAIAYAFWMMYDINTGQRGGRPAPLVPVISFGETDVFRPFNNPEDGLLRKCQEKVRQWTGISPMFPIGRGMFQYTYGVVPLRSPVTTVVGAPMEVQRNLDPTDEEIDIVHADFKRRLIALFENEKSKYLENPEKVQLTIT